MSGALYVAACLAVPALWGALMYVAFGLLQRRRRPADPHNPAPPADYTI